MSDETSRPRRSDRHRKAPRLHKPREIRGVQPASVSRQNLDESLRPRKRSDALDPKVRRRRRGRIAIIAAAVVAVLVVAGAVAAYAMIANVDSKIHSFAQFDPTFQNQLKQEAPAAGAPFYMLLMGDDARPGETRARSDTLILTRVDPKARTVQMISIMRDSRVPIPGFGTTKINAAYFDGGPELAMKTVSALTGLPITKFLVVNFTGFESIVNAMGGVWLNVPEKINGVPNGETPTAWDLKNRIIKQGYQKLNGMQALTFVRARHQFASQDYQRVKDQQMFLKALAKQALQVSKVFSAQQMLNAVADNIRTNMSLSELAGLALQMQGMKSGDLQTETAPSAPAYVNGVAYVVIDQTKFGLMLDKFRQGLPVVPKSIAASSTAPAQGTTSLGSATVAPSSITMTVRNGAGVSGLAQKTVSFFKSKGFKVVAQGNAAQFVYGKTLVVYKTGGDAKAAAVIAALGYGQAVPAAGMYQFNSDILVVIGKDWTDPTTH
jgi:LCP family protein required for cell wall assembly